MVMDMEDPAEAMATGFHMEGDIENYGDHKRLKCGEKPGVPRLRSGICRKQHESLDSLIQAELWQELSKT